MMDGECSDSLCVYLVLLLLQGMFEMQRQKIQCGIQVVNNFHIALNGYF